MKLVSAIALLSATLPASAIFAQTQPATAIAGTRLDVVATGEVARVPDIVRINAGVSTRAPTASEAIRANGAQIDSMRAALRRAGVEARDVQTSSVNLDQDWRNIPNAEPEFVGYRASHQLSVRFRDASNAGRILDALVAAGANEINGPSFEIDRPEAALDEARTQALAAARARAELYARGLGMRVRRIISVSEEGASRAGPGILARSNMAQDATTNIVLGEQAMAVTLNVVFELE
jgi:hypothetical protein